MRDLIIGVLLGAMVFGPSARALDIQMTNITVRDVFAATALAGLIQKSQGKIPLQDVSTESFRIADAMMEARQ